MSRLIPAPKDGVNGHREPRSTKGYEAPLELSTDSNHRFPPLEAQTMQLSVRVWVFEFTLFHTLQCLVSNVVGLVHSLRRIVAQVG